MFDIMKGHLYKLSFYTKSIVSAEKNKELCEELLCINIRREQLLSPLVLILDFILIVFI